MFFYLIYNSTLVSNEIDEKNKYTKVFLYGCISYIVLHATLFIGGKEALLYSLKNYFWLFLILDVITLILTYNSKNKNKITLDLIISKFKLFIPNIHKQTNSILKNNQNKQNLNSQSQNNLNSQQNNRQNIKKKVSFNENNDSNIIYDYVSSDSDSDIDTDLDLDEFKRSLNN